LASFITKFNAAGSTLVYSTYLDAGYSAGLFVALGSDGSAYVGGSQNATVGGQNQASSIHHIDPTGSELLGSVTTGMSIQAMALGPDGNLYFAGAAISPYRPTSEAFQQSTVVLPNLPGQTNATPSAIAKINPQLDTILSATYFGGPYYLLFQSLAFDAAGNVYAGGYTAPYGLPTRTPFVEAFGPAAGTGFLSELSNDLTTLLFSSYLGNTLYFGVNGLAIGSGGSVIIGGATGALDQTVLAPPYTPPSQFDRPAALVPHKYAPAYPQEVLLPAPGLVVLNSLTLTGPPSLRIDSIQNAASLLDGPISAGETIVVNGAGFGSDSQLSIGDTTVPLISLSPTQIVASVQLPLSGTQALLQVQSGGGTSNVVKVPVASASPGIFSANGSGYGQGYILNKDGTLNTPSNPASPGDQITIYATGVGPVSVTQGYATTQSPVNVLIYESAAEAVAAVYGPVAGFPGSVYQLTLVVPNSPYDFQPLVGVIMQIAGATSQNGIAISLAP
jgi:uncharacterized protein (TIGR03437 family)